MRLQIRDEVLRFLGVLWLKIRGLAMGALGFKAVPRHGG